jgi:hypothetical protein
MTWSYAVARFGSPRLCGGQISGTRDDPRAQRRNPAGQICKFSAVTERIFTSLNDD